MLWQNVIFRNKIFAEKNFLEMTVKNIRMIFYAEQKYGYNENFPLF